MKLLWVFLLGWNYLFAQKFDYDCAYLGLSFSPNDGQYVIVQGERHLDRYMAQVTFMSNLGNIQRLNVKMGYAIIHRSNLKWYLSLPPMYYYFGKGYKTPLNTEIRFNEKIVINLDIYKDVPVFSIQFKTRF